MTDEIQNAPELAQDSGPQISPELLEMGQTEAAAQPAPKPELAPLEKQATLDPARIAATEKVVQSAAGGLFLFAQTHTGRELGLNDRLAGELAKGVAPCLVKYGIGEPSELFTKWEVELKAAMAIGAVVYAVWKAEREYKIEQEQAHKMTTAQPVTGYGNQSQ